jgi:hypothetical protein
MKYLIKLMTVLLLFAVFLIVPLCADDFFAVKDKTIDESRFKLGFLYVTPLILLENVGYTSNIYTYAEKENPDWSGDLGLGLRASTIMADRFILQAESLPHYSFYLKNKNLRSWSNRFAATLYSHFGPLNLKGGYAQDDLTRRPYFEFSRPLRYTDREWSGETDIGRFDKLFLTAYVAFKNLTYDEDSYLEKFNLTASLSNRQNVFGLKINKSVFSRTVIYLNYEMRDYAFASATERDARSHAIGVGVEFPEIGILQGSFQIGTMRMEPKNQLFLPRQSLNGSGEVSLSLFERLRFNASFSLGTNFSYQASDVFYQNQSLGGGAEIYLTRFLKGGAAYEDGRLKYYSFLDLKLNRNDRVRQQRYYLAVPFFGNTSLGFAYTVYRLSSDVLKLDYTRSFWGGFISHEF